MDFSDELKVVKELYTSTEQELEQRQRTFLANLVVAMKQFVQIYEAHLEQKSRLSNLDWKLRCAKNEQEREDSEEDE